MKTEDFERLKEICEKEGFKVLNESVNDNDKFYVVVKKDPWGGVEFAECISVDKIGDCVTKSKIYKIEIFDNELHLVDDSEERDSFIRFHENFQPSTQQAYIEQLKKESFKRFGEIKEGDRFENPNGGKDKRVNDPYWSYNKRYDWLYYGGCMLYKQGKWAERVKEMIKVTYIDWEYADNKMEVNFSFKINDWKTVKDKDDVGDFLAKQLEEYLNRKDD